MSDTKALPAVLLPAPRAESRSLADRQQLAAWYQHYAARVYNFMRYRTACPQDAQDLTQITFERVWQHFHRFDAQKGDFAVWLFRIARNVLYSFGRSSKRLQTDGGESLAALYEPGAGPEAQLLAREEQQRLQRALGSLSQKQRTFVALKYGSGLRNTEIARIMGVSEQNTGVILHRSLKKLRIHLEKENRHD